MKTQAVIILFLTLVAVSTQYPLQNDDHLTYPEFTGPEREISDRMDEYNNSIDFTDYEAISKFYTEDCKGFFQGLDVVEGREGVKELLRNLVEEEDVISVPHVISDIGFMGANYSFVWGTYEAYVSFQDSVAEYGKFFQILKKVDGEWFIHFESSSASPYQFSDCVDDTLNRHKHGEEWSTDLCTTCYCNNGATECNTIQCDAPPYPAPICNVTISPSECCPTFECTEPPAPESGPCFPNPCENNGICNVKFRYFYSCSCKEGFEGKNCELEVPPIELNTQCVDEENGMVYQNGESWKVDKCMECLCEDGLSSCVTPLCMPPPENCVITDDSGCCPIFECTTVPPIELNTQCTNEEDGMVYQNGESWKVDKCVECVCDNGLAVCLSASCASPLYDANCVITDDGGCCPIYECTTAEPETVTRDCPTACFFLYLPVCGSDGNTYDNECELDRAACNGEPELTVDYTGVCDISHGEPIDFGCTLFCTSEYDPVCGSNGKTYGNDCEMSKEACEEELTITEAYKGECTAKEPTKCQTQLAAVEPMMIGAYIPQCTEDGEFEPKQCHGSTGYCWCVNVDGEELDNTRRGPTEEEIGCLFVLPELLPPTCTSDGIEYKNGETFKPKDSCVACVCVYGQVTCPEFLCAAPSNPLCVNKGTPEGECCPEYECPEEPEKQIDECPEACIFIYEPVCGSNGETYSNECELRKAACGNTELTLASEGECPPIDEPECPEACIFIYEPVCGSDGETYSNECELRKAACGNTELTLASEGECPPIDEPECNIQCNRMYRPVCGSDGKTHSNECMLRFEACMTQTEITQVAEGPCPEPREPTACETLASTVDPMMLGAYIAQCDVNGEFVPKQCHGSSGDCWCVNVDGVELDNTRRGPTEEEIECFRAPPFPVLEGCTYAGVEYKDGESFRPKDHCMDCVCRGGDVSCPVVDCAPPPFPSCVSKGTPEGECCPEYECEECPDLCLLDYEPVCGTDGVTYTNECELRIAACGNPGLIFDYEGECRSITEPECPEFCPSIFAPVCGSNGETYSNECEMGAATCGEGVTVMHRGECVSITLPECPEFCTSLYEPVCGSNGETYGNECEMTKATCGEEVTITFNGRCEDKPVCQDICARIYAPVCGTDGTTTKTYSNRCEMEAFGCNNNLKIVVLSEGECPPAPEPEVPVLECPEFCTSLYEPVCGSNGETYSNECEMTKATCGEEVTVTFNGRCEDKPVCQDICPEDYAPVCGTDGTTTKTYSNQCEMEAFGCNNNLAIAVLSEGECPPAPEPALECPEFCTSLYEPVCGSNGETYSNECEMTKATCGEEVTVTFNGRCEDKPVCQDICPAIYAPVCGTDGTTTKTYSNRCEMEAFGCNNNLGIVVLSEGECPPAPEPETASLDCPEFCTSLYEPVCGSNGETYSNECEMTKATCDEGVTVTFNGRCEDKPVCQDVCTLIYAPVCGTNGETYPSECAMEAFACNNNMIILVASQGECPPAPAPEPDCPEACIFIYEPVCGSNGETYSNECELRKAACLNTELTQASEGACSVAFDAGFGTTTPPGPTEQWFFTTDLEDAWVVRYSQPVTLSCGADVASTEATISFECNGEIMDTARVEYSSITPGTVKASIDISRDEVEAANNKFICQCVASTSDFTVYRSSPAEVGISFFRKAWDAEPSSQTVNTGDSLVLECRPPVGRPDAEVTWEKDGQMLDATQGGFIFNDNGSLEIPSASADNAGSYVCIASNPAKTRRSKTATVTVN